MKQRRAWKGLSLAAVAWAVCGCATPRWLCWFPPGPHQITLITAPDANNSTAVGVDLVFISGEAAAKQIAALPAAEFFAQREQLQRDYPDEITVRSWELAPRQTLRDTVLGATCNRSGTLLFARYATPGAHREALDGQKAITVRLEQNDFSIGP